MKSDRLYAVLLTILFSCGGFFLSAHRASAGMDGVHDGTHSARPAQAARHMREAEVGAQLTTEPEHVTAGIPATVRFSLNDAEGKPLQGLTLMHARYLHVVIVGQDFSVFAHIHPRDFERLTPDVLKGGRFFVRFTFPKAGRYIVGIDFAVKGRPFGRHFIIDVAGEHRMTFAKKDFTRKEKADGLDVVLATTPARITANKEVLLSYVFRKDDKPVTDLEPWLAAPMHLAIVSSDLKYFLHVHGEVPGMSPHGHHEDHMHMAVPTKFGPGIEVPVVFPAKGLYEVFGQVGYEGKVILTKFMVEVK
jgi:hypothetical protein